jgi:hypothetical protein
MDLKEWNRGIMMMIVDYKIRDHIIKWIWISKDIKKILIRGKFIYFDFWILRYYLNR